MGATVWIQVSDVCRVEAAELLLRHRVCFKHLYWTVDIEASVWEITDERFPAHWHGKEVRIRAALPYDAVDEERGVDGLTIEIAKPPPPATCLPIMGTEVCFFCRQPIVKNAACPAMENFLM